MQCSPHVHIAAAEQRPRNGVEHNFPEMSKLWFESLGLAILTGEVPFVLSYGEEVFAYMDHQPEFDGFFTHAVEAVEELTGTEHLQDFDRGRFDRLIDAGGSNGK